MAGAGARMTHLDMTGWYKRNRRSDRNRYTFRKLCTPGSSKRKSKRTVVVDQISGWVDRQNVGACSQQPGSGEWGSRRSDFTELKVPDVNGWLRRLPNSESRTLAACI